MSAAEATYTYRAGKKVKLEKSPDKLVVRVLPGQLDNTAVVGSEQVSSASTRVVTTADKLESVMARNRNLAPTHHAYYETDTGAEFLISDRIFVIFKQSPSHEQLDEFAGRYGLVKKTTYSDKEFLFQLTNHTDMNPVKLVVTLMEHDDLIEVAEHDLNQRMSTYAYSRPTDPEYSRQWHLHTDFNDPQYDARSCSLCEPAWKLLDDFGSDNVVVAVSDDGCKLDHHDFDSENKFRDWGYFRGERLITSVDIDANPDEMFKPGANHGTSCAGVIAGETDSVLTVGAGPGCQLAPYQWESSGPSLFISDSKMLMLLNHIANKVDVMSNSWGGVPTSLWALPVVNRIRELAVTGGRRGKGIVFLWAAGNDNSLINHTASVNVPFDRGVEVQGGALVWVGVSTTRVFRNNLADLSGVMHVAALASTAKRSHYSNYGPGISLCAPTSNTHTYFRLTVDGLGITTATGESGGVTSDFGGTSSATPLVAGIAALTISANPNLSALDVISILKRTASKDLNFEGYPKTPPANFDPDTSWDVSPIPEVGTGEFVDRGDADGTWSPWFGHGRVDAEAAIAEALRLKGDQGDQTFQAESSPGTNIPDNNTNGITNRIQCNKDFGLSSVKVRVDITHTFIGDLRVTLITPSGTAVVLHDRSGGSANDLHREFDVQSTPGLHTITGEMVNGEWILKVQDLAGADIGTLDSWRLDLAGGVSTEISVEEAVGVSIPDNSVGGIERSLRISNSGQLNDLVVELDITHTFVGDLVVELVSPNNTAVRLHNRTGGSADNIIKTYSKSNTPGLQAFRGESVNGDWKLKVSDLAAADKGKLNRWGLTLMPA